MHRHDQNTGRGRHDSNRNRDDERDERGYDTRSSEQHERQHSRWMDMDDDRRRDEGRSHEGQQLDESRRFGGRGYYDRDREYLSRGGQGGYGGYGGSGERPAEHRQEEMRRFDRGHDQPQDYGTRSIGFRGRMGEDYGYGGFGHMGQSDLYSDRHMGRDDERQGMGRGMDRGFGGTDRGYGMERYSDRYAHDRNYSQERSGMRPGYGGIDRNYDPQRTDERGMAGQAQMRGPAQMRGKGPKNYSRSDDRIREEVCELLEDADLDASDIEVKVREGEVTLEGTVGDRWAKREAEDVIARARGMKDCHNQLKVQSRQMQQQQQQTQGQSQSQQTQARGNNGAASPQHKQQRTS